MTKTMKRLIYILSGLALLVPTIAGAQKVTIASPTITTVPSIYALDEEVKWVFDFSDSPQVSAGQELYMWTWSPNTPSEPNEPVLLTDEGDKIWSLTMVPTTFYRMTAEEMLNNNETFFWFNIRGDREAISSETGTLQVPKKDYIREFVDGGKMMDFGPSDFWLNSTLSILFNANLVDGFLPAPSTLHMHGGVNDWTYTQGFDAWIPETRVKTQFKDMGNGIYKKDLVPIDYFPGVTEETNMENIAFVIAKYNGNDATPDWAGASPDLKIIAPGAPIPPPAKFYIFPMKVSMEDIMIINRDNNDNGQELSYTITGGGKTITGRMEGAKSQQRAYIDLAAEFKSTGATTLNVKVTDNRNNTIYEGDIPLVTVDKPTK